MQHKEANSPPSRGERWWKEIQRLNHRVVAGSIAIDLEVTGDNIHKLSKVCFRPSLAKLI
jgi:hypothetical protein